MDEAIAAARAYDAFFVPALFGEWAPRVADAAYLAAGQRVLDAACGTGVLTREAASRAGSSGRIAGVDVNAGMLTVARSLSPAVWWQQAAAESLPFVSNAFDAVVSQFGLMFMHRDHAIREMLRVLDTNGHLAVAVWAGVDTMPAYAMEVDLLQRLAGTRAADALRAPFALGNRDDLARLFEEAGARAVTIDTREGAARFPNIRAFMEADLRGWLPVMGVTLTEEEIVRILAEAEHAFRTHVDTDGRMRFTTQVHIVCGTKPSH
ncbi:MAG: methyltransferase domain-containing protein [Acidobacteria bacterium]|nr:methyltransferase domain-containing protein [Acidobacteriota bacterium]